LTRMIWDAVGTRFYENGIDRGVLYIGTQPGVPWNGLTSITDDSISGTSKSYYVDGEKYLNEISREEFQATLTAFTYPDQFEVCNGNSAVRPGILVTKQEHVPFGLSYRTMTGNDTDSIYYRIHILYNLLASPAGRTYKTFSDNVEVDDFSWTLTSVPPVVDGYRRSSHIIIDTRNMESPLVSGIEDILYGTNGTNGRLPSFTELIDLIDTNNALIVVDNGDGTYTLTAPLADMPMLDGSIFQLTWPTAVFIDTDRYTISS
jgi:hypothetical protein